MRHKPHQLGVLHTKRGKDIFITTIFGEENDIVQQSNP
jgi:hypothetical protein